jgi:putative ABC transport system ATP-binding protein
MSAIEISQLQFAYKAPQTVLDIDSLVVKPDEKVFLYGPSGYGKSTLLNLVAGVLPLKHGEIKLLGQSLYQLNGGKRDKFRGENIGYIFQSFNLLPYLTVLENILLPARVNKKKKTW